MALGVTVDFNAHLGNIAGQVDKINDQLNRFQAKAETMSGKVNKAFGALGVGLSVAGVASFVKSGIDAADALNDMADRTGIAVEKLAGFQLATKLADTDMEAFSKSANKLSIYIAKNSEEMAKLGVSAKDPAEAFLQFADAFSQIEDPQRRAALGAAVLGKSYAEMAPLLLQGGAALRQQVEEGQRMSGITTEQAKAAADFNDKLDAMTHHLSTVSIKIAGPVLEGFNQLSDRIDEATKSGMTFNNVMMGIGNFAFGRMNEDIERIGTLSDKVDGINEKIVKAKEHLANAKALPLVSDEYKEEAEKRLNALLFERKTLLLQINAERSKPAESAGGKVDNVAVNKLISSGEDKVAKERASSVDQLARKYDDLVASMSKEVALRGDNTEAAKMEYEVVSGSLSGLSEAQKIKLRNLAAEKDAIELNVKAYEEYDQVIAEGLDLAKKQRSDMASEADRLNQKFNGTSIDFNKGLSDALDARHTIDPNTGLNIIPNDAELKKVLDKMGRDYNGLTEDAKNSTDEMSQFAVQAARNMQTSFADFLFDPFKDGMTGMADNFATELRRMAANALSAKLMEGLMGPKADGQGGWVDKGVSGLASLFGSMGGGSGGNFQGNGMLLSYANATGNIFNQGSIVPFAKGAVFDKPVNFPMAGGNIGLLGEAGPEAIMPLTRGADGKLGIRAANVQQAPGHTINVYVGSGSAPDVRRSAAQGAREGLAMVSGASRYA